MIKENDMLKNFFPYECVKSVFDIDYKKLYDLGYRGILFDIDNTLVLHGEDSTPEIDQLFRYIHSIGLKTFLLSNNNIERIERFTRNIDTLYIPEADKPQPLNYRKAVEMLELKISEVVFVGDQLFTDIRGANRCGMANILVDFLKHPGETNFGKKRAVEKYILKFYKMHKSLVHRLGNINLERNDSDYAEKTEKTVL